MATLGLPPGPLAAYLGVRNSNQDFNQENELNQVRQASGMQGILAKLNAERKEQMFKSDMAALGPNPTQESLVQLAAKHAAPKDILHYQQSSLDAKERIAALLEQKKIDAQTRMDMARLVASNKTHKPNVITGPDGSVKMYDNAGNLIKDLGVAGKPSAAFEKGVAAKKKMEYDLGQAITELESATVDGGLIDKSTGSGIGAGVDWAASLVGKATPGSIAVGKMKPIFDLALKMVPRFEGPQSDKDTQSYREAAGELANPNVPNERKKAAGREILRLMKARRGQFISKDFEGTEVDRGNSGWKDL